MSVKWPWLHLCESLRWEWKSSQPWRWPPGMIWWAEWEWESGTPRKVLIVWLTWVVTLEETVPPLVFFCKGRKSCKEKKFSEKHITFYRPNVTVTREAKGDSASSSATTVSFWVSPATLPVAGFQSVTAQLSETHRLLRKWLKFTFHF